MVYFPSLCLSVLCQLKGLLDCYIQAIPTTQPVFYTGWEFLRVSIKVNIASGHSFFQILPEALAAVFQQKGGGTQVHRSFSQQQEITG